MKYWFLYLAVFVSGASVLAVEILGTRILGPFYGVNLFLWSALISVTLIALSVGYLIGGRWADKGPKISRLTYLMIGAGAWLLLLPVIKQPLLYLAEPLGLRMAVLTAAFVLFAPPLTLLGMISPYAIKLRASNMGEVGQTAGDLYAISTIGSVIAALLTGFVLIPNIGISKLTMMIGVLLLITASAGLLFWKKSRPNALAAGSIWVACFGISWMTPSEAANPEEGLMAIAQSPYAELRVVDVDSKRYLLIDGGTHTIVNPNTWESFFPYSAVVDLSRDFFEKPGEMLLVGLGGGSVVKNFAGDGWKASAVEIDPVVIQMAKNYFGLEDSEGDIFCQDGRQFLLSNDQKYDIVVMDAFGSSSIPFHLITEESFGLIASRLKTGGVLAINLESKSWDDLLVRSLAATLKPHFSKVLALPTHDDAEGLGNMILLAANRPLERTKEMPQWKIPPREYLNSMDYVRDFAWQNRFEPDTQSAPILTDELNPIDLWSESINLQARQGLHHHFGREGLSW